MTGQLYVVATPIGNLQDITLRALDVLKSVDGVAAEDTRHSQGLLAHYGIRKPLLALHEHNERQASDKVLAQLQAGRNIALITDAGTPGISDPGAILVEQAHAAGIRVVPVPGPSAVVTALSAAGLLNGRFLFHGFLPSKAGARRAELERLQEQDANLVFYEAPHRVVETVADMAQLLGERTLVIARELTKTFETIHRLPLQDALAWLEGDANRQRGEFVLIVSGAVTVREDELPPAALKILQILLAELPVKQASKLAAEISGEKKNRLYEAALQLKHPS